MAAQTVVQIGCPKVAFADMTNDVREPYRVAVRVIHAPRDLGDFAADDDIIMLLEHGINVVTLLPYQYPRRRDGSNLTVGVDERRLHLRDEIFSQRPVTATSGFC